MLLTLLAIVGAMVLSVLVLGLVAAGGSRVLADVAEHDDPQAVR